MTSKRISDQINTIRMATEKAAASPEAALAFLRDAGILPQEGQADGAPRKRKATVKAEVTAYRVSFGDVPVLITGTIYPENGAVRSKSDAVRERSSYSPRFKGVKKSK